MRHKKKINHLSRKSAHRKAMLSNMATSLILHKRIHTTVAKAKALKVYVEPLITKSKLSITTKTSKEEATHLRRVVFSYLQSKEAVSELFGDVCVKVADRPGGYTRIIKLPNRLGDNAEMCMIELVDYNENLLGDKDAKAKTASRRKRRGGAKKTADTAVAETPAAEKPKAEAKEKPKAEAKEEPKAEAPKEEPKAEVKEEPKTEAKEEPKAEAKEEPEAKEEKKEDKK
jgi:large subunit ribosomal protein L17